MGPYGDGKLGFAKTATLTSPRRNGRDWPSKMRGPAALRGLLGAGAQLRPFSKKIQEAAYKAAEEIYDEISSKNAAFKYIYENLCEFRSEE